MSAFLIVNAKVPNELKKSFDKWYEEFHLPEAHRCFKSKIAFRGWIGENEHQAFYQFENLSTAKKLLEREIAESELAKKDWEELGEGQASPLTLRIPQLEEARALLNAAEADLEMAKLNLERTIISLPFDGLIQKKNAGIGQYVNAGSVLGSAFSTEKVLIPLPLTDTELSYLGLPLGYEAKGYLDGPKVIFRSFISRKYIEWTGRITRTSGSIDSATEEIEKKTIKNANNFRFIIYE